MPTSTTRIHGRFELMDPSLWRDLLTVGIGFLTGMLSGAFGVGGAVISTPGIRILGASPLDAVGSTLPSILPSAISGSLRYSRSGLVDWRVVAVTTPTGMVASVGGAVLAAHLPGNGHPLMLATATVLALTGARMASAQPAEVGAKGGVDHRADPVPRRPAPAFALIGLAAGGLSGLLGIGGGVVMVPAFSQWARLPLKMALGTSLVCVGLFAIPGTITHALQGDVDWRFALWLCVGVVPGARVGAELALRADERRLRVTVGSFLCVLAVVYAAAELAALR